ncbi:uncharacterized protein LOC135946978 [Cloeon dipterum]|uniref:uncharacterized protein LOC135946978 n=1 Tax=Cloeon dipterum TaxID=197152 RepID=UPI0032206E97
MPTWMRPSAVPPQIWLRENGIVVRDVTPDLDEYVIDLMAEIHSREAPLSKSAQLYNDQASLEDVKRMWRHQSLPQRVSLVALAEGSPGADMEPVTPENPPIVLGANVLRVKCKADPEQNLVQAAKGKAFMKVFSHMEKFGQGVDLYERFQIDHYLDAVGLAVGRSHRGLGISEMLLRARRDLCTRLGIPLTKTVFTSTAAQRAAKRVGFQVVKEMPFSEMKDDSGACDFPDLCDGNQTVQLCAWKFN